LGLYYNNEFVSMMTVGNLDLILIMRLRFIDFVIN